MSESILQESLAENTELRKKLSELERRIESIEGFHSNIQILSEKPMVITGVLISEGVWKGIKYDYNEMKKALDKFKNLPVKAMHSKSDEFGDKELGKVIQVGKDDLLKALTFKAEITDEKAQQLIKDGVFNAVSIAGSFKELTNETPPVGMGYEPLEVSLTGSPACSNCYIFSVEELSKSFEEKALSKDATPKNVGEQNMSVESKTQEVKETKPQEDLVEIKENQVLVTPENFEELAEDSEFDFQIVGMDNLTQELAKAVKKKAVVKVPGNKYPKVALKGTKKGGRPVLKYPYYYGYPYYYYYGYPYYEYYGYGYPSYGSLEEILDVLELAENYRTFMKKCMKEKGGGPDALKECAAEWKKQQKAEEEQKPKEEVKLEKKEEVKEMNNKEEPKTETKQELAKIKCPVCGKEFPDKKAFLKHWKEEHEEKYGAYKLIKKLIVQEGLIPTFKHVIELAGEETEEEKKEAPKKLTPEEIAEAIIRESKK